MIPRRSTHLVKIGTVRVGSDAPVVVQSMTNTDTADVASTVRQVNELAEAGSELVRVTVNNEESARAVPEIAAQVNVPLVGDFHYNGHRLLAGYSDMAAALAKYRINPGNVGFGAKQDTQFSAMIEEAIEYGKPIRIGVNWGSLDQQILARLMDENAARAAPKTAAEVGREALIISALESAARAEAIGLARDKIILSCKVSVVSDLIAVYRELARRCAYPLHLGLTEAGMGSKGIVASAAALAVLLQEGIGDTIRISLTPRPGESRTEEVRVAQELLQTMGLRSFFPLVVACPGCGRTTSSFFQELAEGVQQYLLIQIPLWSREYVGVESMSVAVMGCIVNGPGESKHANIGISLPGTGEFPAAPVFEDGMKTVTLRGDTITEDFKQRIAAYVARTYKKKDKAAGSGSV